MFCRLRQWRISSAIDDGRDITPALRRHAEHCDSCRRFLECSRRLESVRQSGPAPEIPVRRRRTIRPRWVAASAAGALAAMLVLWVYLGWNGATSPTPQTEPPTAADHAEPDDLEAYLALPGEWADRSLSALRYRSTEPLQRELQHLSRDVEAVAMTLAAYVPRPPTADLRQPPETP